MSAPNLPAVPDTSKAAASLFIEMLIKGYSACDEFDVYEEELETFLERLADRAGADLANEFYFTLHREFNEVSVALTPKAYFDKHGYMYDQHIFWMEKVLPDNFDEVMEATWVAIGATDLKDVYKQLIARGFEWSEQAQALIDRNSTTPLMGEINTFHTGPSNGGNHQPKKPSGPKL
tara:strand:+ start:656 stop:1186 length:531 start_codon:yes stop_codon:yes gene_type:complete